MLEAGPAAPSAREEAGSGWGGWCGRTARCGRPEWCSWPRWQRRAAGRDGRGGRTGGSDRGLGGDQVEGRQAVRELLAGQRPVQQVLLAEGMDEAPILDEIEALASQAPDPGRPRVSAADRLARSLRGAPGRGRPRPAGRGGAARVALRAGPAERDPLPSRRRRDLRSAQSRLVAPQRRVRGRDRRGAAETPSRSTSLRR